MPKILFSPASPYSTKVRMAAAYAGKGVSFMFISPTISMEDGGPQVKALAEESPSAEAQLPLLSDPRHQVTNQFGATKIPEVYVCCKPPGGASS